MHGLIMCSPDTYELPSLTEVEAFINEASPSGVPSAAEVESEGVELSEMNAILLQKLEELTLTRSNNKSS